MINALLIDDEIDALEVLEKKIELYCPSVEVIGKVDTAKEAIKAINKLNPDVVFLDIEMPWMNGFELLESFGEDLNFLVVFVTAYDQYAVKAFKVRAIDYLLKPVDKDDLIACVQRLENETKPMNQEDLTNLNKEINYPHRSNRLFVNSMEGIEIITLEEIVYCQAASNYTYIHTTAGKKVIASKSLSEIEKSLDQNHFIRIHKSYTANIKLARKFSNSDGGMLIFNNGIELPVSRRKKEEVLNAIAGLGN